MKFLSDMIASFEKKLAILLMFMMAVIVTIAVFFRYVFNIPLFWAGEVSIFLLIYITFIGGSLGLKYKKQASVSIVIDNLPEKYKKVVALASHVLILIFMTILLISSIKWISSPNVLLQKSPAILLPMWIPYSILPIGLLFATIHLFNNFLDIAKRGESK